VSKGSIDRRVARTRGLLQQALFRLIVEKGYVATTIEDICREADVGRSTFYTHYPDKDALRSSTIREHTEMLQALITGAEREAGSFAFSRPVFEHARARRELHQALLGANGRDMPDEIRSWISGQIRRELSELCESREAGIDLEIAVRYVQGALVEVMHWWLEKGAILSADEVDRKFQRLAFDGVQATLRKAPIVPRPS
jgi:AcrR family transcriptional regulator